MHTFKLKNAVGPVVVPQGEACSAIYKQIMKEHADSKSLRDKSVVTFHTPVMAKESADIVRVSLKPLFVNDNLFKN